MIPFVPWWPCPLSSRGKCSEKGMKLESEVGGKMEDELKCTFLVYSRKSEI